MKYRHLLDQMTLSEKCGLLSGKDNWSTKPIKRLEVNSIFLSDGPSGLRKQVGEGDHLGLNASLPATCWPSAATVANSWDLELCERLGQFLGKEALSENVNVVLGPGLNIKRSPLCGRNFEYFSEDPYLSGKLAASCIRGIQSQGIAACPKHFAVNSQELNRMTNDSIVDERTFREIYLTNFEIAVKEANPKFIMSSYNRINGVYANENGELLQDILVNEWGFSGAVVTDWGGSNDRVDGLKAGNHLEMPGTGGDSDRQLEKALEEGRISEELVDRRVNELLDVILSLKSKLAGEDTTVDYELHHNIARRIAEQSAVLLKNEADILPLKPGTTVSIIGDFADAPRYQGAGSSLVNPTKLENTLGMIAKYELKNQGYAPGYRRNGRPDKKLIDQAIKLARTSEVVLLYLGLPEIYETEGLDREHMRLPDNQVYLLRQLATVNPNIVVVLSAGSPIEMPWLESCKALVHGYLSGQAGASALLNIITGLVNPSGKLAETYPIHYEDTAISNYFPGRQRTSEYREGLFVGYRYYETISKPVLFPFGYGLSYTSFAYTDLVLSETQVSFTLTNVGDRAGAEIAQVYVGSPGGTVFCPTKQLKGFAKVYLDPGESRVVAIDLDDKAFRYFNAKTGRWEIDTAEYVIMVGANVQDIHLSGTVEVGESNAISPYNQKVLPSYYSGQVKNVSQSEFELLLGQSIPEAKWDSEEPLGINDALCQMYYAKSRLARLVYLMLKTIRNRSITKGKPNLDIIVMFNVPFRGIAKLTNGIVTMAMAEALVDMVNGHFSRGLGQFIKQYFAASKKRKPFDS